MATSVLIHRARSDSWHWHRVPPFPVERSYEVVAPNLPSDHDSAGLTEYANAVVAAIGDRRDLILVAQSAVGGTLLVRLGWVGLAIMTARIDGRRAQSA